MRTRNYVYQADRALGGSRTWSATAVETIEPAEHAIELLVGSVERVHDDGRGPDPAASLMIAEPEHGAASRAAPRTEMMISTGRRGSGLPPVMA
ncbi:MAG: hypothetical protein ACRDRK_16895 [Pseudonocardia sp.]